MSAAIAEIKSEVVRILREDATLQSLLGTDSLGYAPVFQMNQPVAREDKNFIVYELRQAMDEELSREGRRFAELEIAAEVVHGGTPADDLLDEVEERLDALLQDYRGDTANREVKRCVRTMQSVPAMASDQGAVARSWTWDMVIDDV
jgi:hypothetical protein